MDKGGRRVGPPIWMKIKFYNIIIKFANMDKGGREGGGLNAYQQNVDTFFLNPSLSEVKWAQTASSFLWCTYLNVD